VERKFFCLGPWSKGVVATLLTVAIFISFLLSASPSLHEQLHHDAAQASHQCAITVFQQQHLLASSPSVVVIEANFEAPLGIIVSDCAVISDYTYRFSASRAPPSRPSPLI
jgi:hypothetical protein